MLVELTCQKLVALSNSTTKIITSYKPHTNNAFSVLNFSWYIDKLADILVLGLKQYYKVKFFSVLILGRYREIYHPFGDISPIKQEGKYRQY